MARDSVETLWQGVTQTGVENQNTNSHVRTDQSNRLIHAGPEKQKSIPQFRHLLKTAGLPIMLQRMAHESSAKVLTK
jgi:hypothetical protein